MDGMNPFLGMDPQMLLQRYMPQAMGQMGGQPNINPMQMAQLAGQLPMTQDPQQADRLQKMGKLFSSLGNVMQPPKPQATGPMPTQPPPQAPQMPMQRPQGMGGGAMPMVMPYGNPMQGMPGGMGQGQVPPADIMKRLLTSLSPYGG